MLRVSGWVILQLVAMLAFGEAMAQASWRGEAGAPSALGIRAQQGGEIVRSQPILRCDKGKWKLDLGLMMGFRDEEPAPLRLVIDGKVFPTTVQHQPDGNWVSVPKEAVAALKTGTSMTFDRPGEKVKPTVFSLRGAGQEIDHVARMCGVRAGQPGPDHHAGLTPATVSIGPS